MRNKKYSSLILIFFFFCISNTFSKKNDFNIKTGVNVSHWLSQNFTGKTGPERYSSISESDFKTIAQNGFDHVRIPIDEQEMWAENGKPIDYTFNLLENGIKWSIQNNLNVIVDLHIIRSHHFNEQESNTLWTDPEEQEKMVKMW